MFMISNPLYIALSYNSFSDTGDDYPGFEVSRAASSLIKRKSDAKAGKKTVTLVTVLNR